jgi:hypothetical protein
MTRDRDLPLTLYARASWLRERAEECVRQANELKAAGRESEARAFLCLAESYRARAELRAVEEAANG